MAPTSFTDCVNICRVGVGTYIRALYPRGLYFSGWSVGGSAKERNEPASHEGRVHSLPSGVCRRACVFGIFRACAVSRRFRARP